MITIDKIYEMINRDSGASIKCSEKYLVQWVARGFEVQSFILEETLNEEYSKFHVSLKVNRKTADGFPLLSSNLFEYTSSDRGMEQASVMDAIEFYRRKSV